MSRAKKIKYIVIHCTAGYGNVESIKKFWKTRGWKSVGYHRVIGLQGEIHELSDFEKPTNGVKSFNDTSIHIAYIGGVYKDNVNKSLDSRTDRQKAGILEAIKEVIDWLKENGNDLKEVMILGHRDFSKDQNKDNVIAPWERIKECPSFDAIPEYKWIFVTKDNKADILPNK